MLMKWTSKAVIEYAIMIEDSNAPIGGGTKMTPSWRQ